MSGELNSLATAVKGAGEADLNREAEHIKQEIAEFTKVSRIEIRVGDGDP